MSKACKVILFISLAANLTLGYLLYNKPNYVSVDTNQFTEKIDSLKSELLYIQKLRDKVQKEIDTIYVELKSVDKEYVKTRERIINNSSSDDYRFFVEYLERNSGRLDSVNNF